MKHRYFIQIIAPILAALLCGCSARTVPLPFPEATPAAQEQAVSQSNADAVALILDIPTTQYFTDEAVIAGDIDTILMAGINAPSAMNSQPWHFSAITDASVIAEISSGMSFGVPPAGVTGMPEGAEPPMDMGKMPEGAPSGNDRPAPPTGTGLTKAAVEDAPLVIVVSCKTGSEFNAGLACQNMSAVAQLLGYGTKIVSSPTMAINAEGQDALRATLGMPQSYTACALLLIGKEDTSVDTTADTYASATTRNPLSDTVTYLIP